MVEMQKKSTGQESSSGSMRSILKSYTKDIKIAQNTFYDYPEYFL